MPAIIQRRFDGLYLSAIGRGTLEFCELRKDAIHYTHAGEMAQDACIVRYYCGNTVSVPVADRPEHLVGGIDREPLPYWKERAGQSAHDE